MSKKHPSDSFLPSGGIASPPREPSTHSSMISPRSQIPRSIPDSYSPSTFHAASHSSSPRPPISPPKTRSGSAEEGTAALVEDWREYTKRLRTQGEGERAHMIADRNRMEEVMAEERGLWDTERELLKSRIRELETALYSSTQKLSLSTNSMTMPKARQQIQNGSNGASPLGSGSGSNAVSSGSVDGNGRRSNSAASTIPQESGRNADGSPFYAPAPRNPSRTFHTSSSDSPLTIGSIIEPRESAIRVTSKELTSSDFGVQSPERELAAIPESPSIHETIDISHIQPELEGVPIKASAVDPVFAAKVLSPACTPAKISPNGIPRKPNLTDITNFEPGKSSTITSPRGGKLDAEETRATLKEPETRRLTLYAGHTPNHSLSTFEFVESGGVTPTQTRADATHLQPGDPTELPHGALTSQAHFELGDEEERSVLSEDLGHYGEEDMDGDKELHGPLGLTNDSPTDDLFLTKLTEKLEEVSKFEGVSPDESITTNSRSLSPVEERGRTRIRAGGLGTVDEAGEGEETEEVDVRPLRLKPSINFGRPLGSM